MYQPPDVTGPLLGDNIILVTLILLGTPLGRSHSHFTDENRHLEKPLTCTKSPSWLVCKPMSFLAFPIIPFQVSYILFIPLFCFSDDLRSPRPIPRFQEFLSLLDLEMTDLFIPRGNTEVRLFKGPESMLKSHFQEPLESC